MCFQVKSSKVFTPKDSTRSRCSSGTPHPVTGLFPLPQPEFQDQTQPGTGPVEAEIPLRPHQRCESLREDVEETGDAKKVEGQKQASPLDQPECHLGV